MKMAVWLLALAAGVAAYDGPTGYWQAGNSWTGTCATGSLQSPLALDTSSATIVRQGEAGFKLFHLEYNPDKVQSHLSGSDFSVYGNFGFVICSDESTNEIFTADVDRVVVKSPAEHVVEGAQADLEVQIFHTTRGEESQQIALVVHFQVSDEEEDGDSFIASVIESVSEPATVDLALAFGRMLEVYNYFTYEGSLTVPPCDEGVSWYVWTYPRAITRDQAAFFASLWQGNPDFAAGLGNNRVVQARGGREIVRYVGDSSDLGGAQWLGVVATLWAVIS